MLATGWVLEGRLSFGAATVEELCRYVVGSPHLAWDAESSLILLIGRMREAGYHSVREAFTADSRFGGSSAEEWAAACGARLRPLPIRR